MYDRIIWHPPFFPGEPKDDADKAWKAGVGSSVLKRFALAAPDYLAPGGRILILWTSAVRDVDSVLGFFRDGGFEVRDVFSKRSWFERFTVYEISRIASSANSPQRT